MYKNAIRSFFSSAPFCSFIRPFYSETRKRASTPLFSLETFRECFRENGDKSESWQGIILGLGEYKSHCEFGIEARSGIMLVIGKPISGWFACMPDFGAGCHLAALDDICWNTEQLTTNNTTGINNSAVFQSPIHRGWRCNRVRDKGWIAEKYCVFVRLNLVGSAQKPED